MATTVILTNQCGCAIVESAGEDSFSYCPTHAAAPEMAAFVRTIAENGCCQASAEARALLARLEG